MKPDGICRSMQEGKALKLGDRSRLALLSGVTAIGLVTGFQAPASAAENITVLGGYGVWSADPSGSTPGDAIKACDTTADGWGIRITLHTASGADRWISTQGRSSPYCTSWLTGNLPEGTTVQLGVQQVKTDKYGGTIYGHSVFVTRVA
jgi:hypothetical protein